MQFTQFRRARDYTAICGADRLTGGISRAR
jgi:hypothetical protein